MATYAIGDIQGCYRTLMALVKHIGFKPRSDRLWLVGDLVNRGADSLDVLRWVKSQGEAVIAVLGNHDLHLLMVAEGFEPQRRGDTLGQILTAPDRDELLGWLRARHLLYREDGYALVHAGLLPQWSSARAAELAREVEDTLRGERYREALRRLYGNQPPCWSDALKGAKRRRVIVNAMTRMRFCSADGSMEFEHNGNPSQAPQGFMPWFEVPGRVSRDDTVVCGHWSTLGLRVLPNLLALDTGCLWGGPLTALRLEDRKTFQVACKEAPH
ncbi:MAG: symmetrical bis(5'-nucleosyl)-tetraphosphatase [Burkholderiales bacterium]